VKSKAPPTDTSTSSRRPSWRNLWKIWRQPLQALGQRIASDPQIRAAAMQVASGAVTTAQQVVAEQSVHIEEALKTAAERISAASPHSTRR